MVMLSSRVFLQPLMVSLCALVPLLSAQAETVVSAAFPDFSGSNGKAFHTNGDAKVDNSALRLTRAQDGLSGSAFQMSQIALPVDGSFSAYFTLNMSQPKCDIGGGADGIAFLVRSDPMASGELGHGIGYAGTTTSIAIELDTYLNPEYLDPGYQHVGLNLHGDPKSVAVVKSPFVLNDGKTYHVWVDYDGKRKVIEVRLSDSASRPASALLTHTVDVTAITGSDIYVGFSAATGSCMEQHEIRSLYFHNDLLVGGIDPSVDTYVAAPSGN
jgi:hypothetical protein